MQKEKGVTLISVTIYIIVMLIIVSVITVITSYFYNNVDVNAVSQDINQQYTRFNSYFTEEINKKGNKVIDIQSISTTGTEGEIESNTNQQNYIVFSSGNQYTYIPANKGIYMNNVKIAQNIKEDLEISGLLNNKNEYEKFYVSSNPENFKKASELFYKLKKAPLLKSV